MPATIDAVGSGEHKASQVRNSGRSRRCYEVLVEVPHGDAVGSSLLQNAGSEIMFQTRSSIAADMASLSSESFRSIVYIDVPNVVDLSDTLRDIEELVPLRTTFYGAVERFVREPGGNVIGLSSPA